MCFFLAAHKLHLDSYVAGRPLAVGKVQIFGIDIHQVSVGREMVLFSLHSVNRFCK